MSQATRTGGPVGGPGSPAQSAAPLPPAGRWAWFGRGARDITPILIGVIPFATVAGLELFGRHAPAWVIVITALIINLRFAMYGASLAPHLRGLPLRVRALLAYLVTDQAYAVASVRFPRIGDASDRGWYFFGAAAPMCATWQAGHAAGYFLGTAVPAEWSLEFSIPLTLLALLVGGLGERTARFVALATAAAVPLASLLPLRLGLIAAIVVGVAVGSAIDRHAA